MITLIGTGIGYVLIWAGWYIYTMYRDERKVK